MVHEKLWEQLSQESTEQVCRRTGAQFEAQSGGFSLQVLDGTLRVNPCTRQLEWVEAGSGGAPVPPDLTIQVAATAYLLSARDVSLPGSWVSPLDLPPGAIFFRGPHGLPTEDLEAAFGASAERFRAAAEALKGTPLGFADVAYRFSVFPRLAVAVLLWLADDEFPARVRFLVERAAVEQLALDGLLAVLHMVAERLLQLGRGAEGEVKPGPCA